MYRWAFPKCKVISSFQPSPFAHLASHGAVPEKCTGCPHLFEGSCTRAFETIKDYQVLDHGPCPVQGSTAPVPIKSKGSGKLFFIPKKCSDCQCLTSDEIRGFTCSYETEIWGDLPRSLDWGEWSPPYKPIGVQGKIIATIEVIEEIMNRRIARAALHLKQLYPTMSTAAAIQCVQHISDQLCEDTL